LRAILNDHIFHFNLGAGFTSTKQVWGDAANLLAFINLDFENLVHGFFVI
jgi:hypothetical protein